jgi:segregation and condensation protein B
MDIPAKILAILFWKGEPLSQKKLCELLKLQKTELDQHVKDLERRLENSGITIVSDDENISLGTAKELSPLIEEITKEEISKDLGKAGLETLSIILYQGPISRSDIDYIRGVNSQFIIRNLLVRGLVERVENSSDARIFLYRPTLALLSHLGVNKITDLPDYEKVRNEIESFKKSEEQNQS